MLATPSTMYDRRDISACGDLSYLLNLQSLRRQVDVYVTSQKSYGFMVAIEIIIF